MKVQVYWSSSASTDLFEIVDFIARDRRDAAGKAGRSLLADAGRLRANPRQGRVVPELREHGVLQYREIVVSPYRLIYRVHEDEVRIMAVFDSRRDLADLLLERLLR